MGSMGATTAPLSTVAVGDLTITYLPDGASHLRPLAAYVGSDEQTWREQGHLLDDNGWLVMSVGALLVQDGRSNTLIDVGMGPHVQDVGEASGGLFEGDIGGGSLLVSLARVGLRPDDIDDVVFSHLHTDHVGWVETGGAATFSRANYHVGADELAYWGASSAVGGPTAAQLEVLARRLTLIAGDRTVLPGIDAVATPGHTPGHLSLVVSSGTERAVILGDMMHCPIEIGATELDFAFDVDPQLARETKRRIERELSKPDTVTVGAHFPDPVFGRVLPGSAPFSVTFRGGTS